VLARTLLAAAMLCVVTGLCLCNACVCLPAAVVLGGGAVIVLVAPVVSTAGGACPFPFLAAAVAASVLGVAGLGALPFDDLRALQATLLLWNGWVCIRRESTLAAGALNMAGWLPLLVHNLHR
jgi:hypothetical protein